MIEKEPFPITSCNQGLVGRDFRRFSQAFSDILQEKMITADRLEFIFDEQQLREYFSRESCIEELVESYREVIEDGCRVSKIDRILLLPFVLSDGCVVVAVFSGLDPLFIRRVTDDWLFDIRQEARRNFLLLKQARIDELTGLFNLSNLNALLDTASAVQNVQLLVVEHFVQHWLYPEEH